MIKTEHIPEENWRSSTYSQNNGGECVQIADGIPHNVPVRDSKMPEGPHLTFPHAAFDAFVHAVRQGGFGPS
ncbi:DUF397 domain-containing protein [Streptomyces sp. NPDC059134]|uniref:DUF397 domain-containing protein n=1 Tax=Streptomyces sp. NPDC059134 TaxID=3346738 RepID=UPI0036B1E152